MSAAKHTPARDPPDTAAIVRARLGAGLTQEQAAGVIGKTRRQWTRYESGATPMPALVWELWRYRLRGMVRVHVRASGRRAPRPKRVSPEAPP